MQCVSLNSPTDVYLTLIGVYNEYYITLLSLFSIFSQHFRNVFFSILPILFVFLNLSRPVGSGQLRQPTKVKHLRLVCCLVWSRAVPRPFSLNRSFYYHCSLPTPSILDFLLHHLPPHYRHREVSSTWLTTLILCLAPDSFACHCFFSQNIYPYTILSNWDRFSTSLPLNL